MLLSNAVVKPNFREQYQQQAEFTPPSYGASFSGNFLKQLIEPEIALEKIAPLAGLHPHFSSLNDIYDAIQNVTEAPGATLTQKTGNGIASLLGFALNPINIALGGVGGLLAKGAVKGVSALAPEFLSNLAGKTITKLSTETVGSLGEKALTVSGIGTAPLIPQALAESITPDNKVDISHFIKTTAIAGGIGLALGVVPFVGSLIRSKFFNRAGVTNLTEKTLNQAEKNKTITPEEKTWFQDYQKNQNDPELEQRAAELLKKNHPDIAVNPVDNKVNVSLLTPNDIKALQAVIPEELLAREGIDNSNVLSDFIQKNALEEVNKEQLQSFFEEALVTQNNIRKFDVLAKTLKTKPIDLCSLLAKRYTNLDNNLDAYQKAAQQRLFKALFQGMSEEELAYLQNKDNDISIARALDGKAAPELAKQLAKKIEEYIDVRNPELIISNALRLREVNKDRFIRAAHDQGLISQGGRSAGIAFKNLFKRSENKAALLKTSKEKWLHFIKLQLDLEKTFGTTSKTQIEQSLSRIFDNIITGKSEIFTRSVVANDREAVQRKSHLFFYWKDHEAFLNYSREYGKGNLFQALIGDLNGSANKIGLAELFGDSPFSVYNDLKKIQQEKDPKSGLWYRHTDNIIKQAMQQDQAAISPTLGAFGTNTRTLGAIARLSTIVLRSLPDAAYIASFAQRWGNDYFKSLAYTLSHTFDSFADAERKFIAKQFKLLADSHLGYIARFADLTNGTELIHKVATGFFRTNLLESFDKGNRHSLMHIIAKGLYKQREQSWKNLKVETRFQLQKYGLNEKEWNLLRTKNQQGLFTTANVDTVTDTELKQLYCETKSLYEMRNDLHRKVFSLFSIAADNAVLVPDNFTKAFMYFGTRPGTIIGEALRMVMQFKGFAINFADKVLVQGYQDARNTQMRLRWGLALVAGTLPLSYLSDYFDNLAHGKSMPLFSSMNRQEKMDYLINLVQPNLGIFMQVFDPKHQDKGSIQNLFSSPSINFLSSVVGLAGATTTLNPQKMGKNIKNMTKNILPIDTLPVIGPYFNQLLGDQSYLEPGQKMIYGK